jgi:hypothetical protein
MDLSDRFMVGKILITEFGRLAEEIDPYDDDLPEIIKRALYTRLKMKCFCIKYDEPPEMVEQLAMMDSVIKTLELKQNRYATDM